jgi:HAD superfamily hydrolase (TIGR01549 family)
MIIIIPLGGLGERFKKDGYTIPKALIPVENKQIIFYLLDNLIITNNINFVYIPYNKEYIDYNIEHLLINRYPNIKFKFFKLEYNTRGSADTIRIALNNINQYNDCPILCLDSDNFYTIDIIKLWNGQNKIFTFIDKLNEPIYSYIIEDNNYIKDIIEKEKISDNACCGAYGFNSWKQLLYYINLTIDNKITIKNEYYTSTVIKQMIINDIHFKNEQIECKYYYSLGTPNQVKEYEWSILFDLDGTLVNTDNIYIEVWNIIFKKYNINLTIDDDFFNHFIKGKNDLLFLTYLFPNIKIEFINEISNLKDDLFIELLKNKNESILLPGVIDFFERNNNRRIVIVTSCNKKAAEYIIEFCKLNNFISLLITSDDCNKYKPDPEPYLKAISMLNLNKNKTIIFEDSYSGYISAKHTNVYKIILICNEASCNDIINIDEYKIKDYTNININDILYIDNNSCKINICDLIKQELKNKLPIKDILKNTIQIKTGYICDINSYKIVYNNNQFDNIILKINNIDNKLSKIAESLNLYNNEINFYLNIHNSIKYIINIPNFYGTINVDKNKTGIMLENLFKYEGLFNRDLNNDIKTLLLTVSEISKIHTLYYFKTMEDLPTIMNTVYKMDNICFYKQLLEERFDIFIKNNKLILKEHEINIMHKCFQNYETNVKHVSTYPLSFCHGDLKSANIFYKYSKENNSYMPYFLDWQYININKSVSDIVFLLVESIKFNKMKVEIVLNYYYYLISESIKDYTYDEYIKDFKICLCIFPFIVCVWFNSECNDKLLDKVFPIRFMKNLLEYYNYFL